MKNVKEWVEINNEVIPIDYKKGWNKAGDVLDDCRTKTTRYQKKRQWMTLVVIVYCVFRLLFCGIISSRYYVRGLLDGIKVYSDNETDTGLPRFEFKE